METRETVKKYWARVRAKENELRASHPDGVVYVTFAEREGDEPARVPNRVQASTPDRVAGTIVDGVHRLATAEEIAAYHQQEEEKGRQLRELELRRQQHRSMNLVLDVPRKA